jgi:NodT family efflux transporter outer membrane factor (OMF) lipoprotein
MKRFACMILIFTSGCLVGPDYRTPKAPLVVNWSEPLESGLTNCEPPIARWWSVFHDPSLDSLIDRAVKYNHSLRQAEAAVRQARASVGVVRADLWPSADATGAYSRNRNSQHGFLTPPGNVSPNYNLYQAGFDASWELDLFGGTRRAIESATANEQAAEFGRDDVLVSLLAEVAVNYVQVRGYQRRIAIAVDNIRSEQDALDITRSRLQGGMASDLDVSQAASVKAATEAAVPSLESALAASIHHLSTLLGQPPGALYNELSAPGPIPAAPPEIPVGLPADLLRRRPDVRRAERQLAAATAQIGVATAELFPKFSLTGSGGLESVSAGDFFTAGSKMWTVGPSAQWRILDAGRIRANIRVQNALQEQALESYETTVLGAFEDAENALAAYAKERSRFVALSEDVRASQRALDVATELYSRGMNGFLSVVVAETTLYNAQGQLAQSQTAIATDIIALYKATAGGWERSGPGNQQRTETSKEISWNTE